MSRNVKPIPEGYTSITPYLILNNGEAAIEFYTKVFGAVEKFRMGGPDRKIVHAEIQIGDAVIMLSDSSPEMGHRDPKLLGGSSVGFMLYVEHVDEVFERAIKAGATQVQPVKNQFYGDRSGTIDDPFGHRWTIGTHVEDVSPEELDKRMKEYTQPK